MLLFTQVGVSTNNAEHAVQVMQALDSANGTLAQDANVQAVTVIPKPEPKVVPIKKIASNINVAQSVGSYFAKTPVLARIAKCESGLRQVDVAGNILRGKVNRKDVGVMQINEQYHASRARALGLDLYSLEGNMAYAALLYKEQGTAPWISSSGCWGGQFATTN